MKNHQIYMRKILHCAASVVEIMVGLMLLVALVITAAGLVLHIDPAALFQKPEQFSAFLSLAATLVLGVEFIKMLCSHTMDAVIEIMLLAIARQMIAEHTSPLENLLAVLAVGVLYGIRKYLDIMPPEDGKKRVFRWKRKL